MKYDLILLQFAKQIKLWYSSINKELANRFMDSYYKEVAIIHKNPFQYQVRYKDVRVALIDTFPYLIHYTVYETQIVIKSIYHTSRDSNIWFIRE